MLMSVSVIAIAGAVSYKQLRRLKEQKSKMEAWVFMCLMLIGVVLVVLQDSRISLPNPVDLLFFLYQPVSTAINRILGVEG